VSQISCESAPWPLAIVDDFDFASQNLVNIEAQQRLLVLNWDLASLGCTGLWMASVYRVLSHDEFVSKYKEALCTDAPDDPQSSPDNGTGVNSPVPIAGVSSPHRGTVQSHYRGHNPIGQSDVVNPIIQPDAKPTGLPCPDTGTGVNRGEQDGGEPLMDVPCPTIGTGAHTIPPKPVLLSGQEYQLMGVLTHDSNERRWVFRSDIGREAYKAEIALKNRLNAERITPEMIQ
jgi:hypothetical protein